MDISYLCWCVIFLSQGCLGQVTDLSGPANMAVSDSITSVRFSCTVEQNQALTTYVGWEECITDDPNCVRIFNDLTNVYVGNGGDAGRGVRYGIINPTTAVYDLTVSPLVLSEDSGTYRCISLNSASHVLSAELILLDGDPVCTNNATNNEAVKGNWVHYTCELSYRGRWAPIMQWKVGGVPVSDVTNESSGNLVKYSFTAVTTSGHHGNVYSCMTFFNPPTGLGPDEATNTPDYQNSFQFSPLIVYYAPEYIEISDGKRCFVVGDVISCNANGNPPPMYQWMDRETGNVISGSSDVPVTNTMNGLQHFWICTASNSYGSMTKEVDFTVQTVCQNSAHSLSTVKISQIILCGMLAGTIMRWTLDSI